MFLEWVMECFSLSVWHKPLTVSVNERVDLQGKTRLQFYHMFAVVFVAKFYSLCGS